MGNDDDGAIATLRLREASRMECVQAYRNAVCGPSLPCGSTRLADVLWTGLCHPLALAVMEQRAPGGGWSRDPFADPEIRLSLPVVAWIDGAAHVHGVAAVGKGTDPTPGSEVDESWDGVAYRIHASPERVAVEIFGTLPLSMDGLAGMRLTDVVDMPRATEPALLHACRALRIRDVSRGNRSTFLGLHRTPWVPAAPTPAWARDLAGVDAGFMDITIVR